MKRPLDAYERTAVEYLAFIISQNEQIIDMLAAIEADGNISEQEKIVARRTLEIRNKARILKDDFIHKFLSGSALDTPFSE